jgi:hypothetical protein
VQQHRAVEQRVEAKELRYDDVRLRGEGGAAEDLLLYERLCPALLRQGEQTGGGKGRRRLNDYLGRRDRRAFTNSINATKARKPRTA